MSIDNLIYCMIPLMKKFECEIICKIIKRGFKPKGKGCVNLKVIPIKYLKSV